MQWEVVIGLENHVQLTTASKIFSGSPIKFGADANTQASPVDLALYRDTVLDRFSNPYIMDTIERVAADGFAKIPGFIAPTIRERLAHHAPFASVAVLPALFLAFLQARAAGGIAFTYKDQAMDEGAVQAILAAPHPVHYFCANPLLWGDLASDQLLEAGITQAYAAVQQWMKGMQHV